MLQRERHPLTSHRFGYQVSIGAVVAFTSPSHARLEFALKLCVNSAERSADVSNPSSSGAGVFAIDGQHLHPAYMVGCVSA